MKNHLLGPATRASIDTFFFTKSLSQVFNPTAAPSALVKGGNVSVGTFNVFYAVNAAQKARIEKEEARGLEDDVGVCRAELKTASAVALLGSTVFYLGSKIAQYIAGAKDTALGVVIVDQISASFLAISSVITMSMSVYSIDKCLEYRSRLSSLVALDPESAMRFLSDSIQDKPVGNNPKCLVKLTQRCTSKRGVELIQRYAPKILEMIGQEDFRDEGLKAAEALIGSVLLENQKKLISQVVTLAVSIISLVGLILGMVATGGALPAALYATASAISLLQFLVNVIEKFLIKINPNIAISV